MNTELMELRVRQVEELLAVRLHHKHYDLIQELSQLSFALGLEYGRTGKIGAVA
jgi:hypothetical protein